MPGRVEQAAPEVYVVLRGLYAVAAILPPDLVRAGPAPPAARSVLLAKGRVPEPERGDVALVIVDTRIAEHTL